MEVIGPGVVAFGDGPDGGREAVYVGAIPYPSAGVPDKWSGTTVFQAKFRQRPQGTKADTTWALAQLKQELRETFGDDSVRTRPTHYVFATNVALSSVPETGGKALADKIAEEFPLIGFHVWDYDKLRAFLDVADGVRAAYAAYITPGDVLAEMMRHLQLAVPRFDDLIANYLEKELLSDQYANLEQAGRVADEQIPISRVFVDLPIEGDDDVLEEDPHVVATALEMASQPLDPQSRLPTETPLERRHDVQQLGRLVVVGGPGQGKTTAGQFLCQLFRTSLLKDRPAGSLTPEAQSAISQMEAQCEEEGIPLPTARRFPIRIALTELSDQLAEETGTNSLLEALTAAVSRRVGQPVPVAVFREWLGAYPWLLVLDGLDEVPASSNRSTVMDAIRDFWVDATQANCDLLVVATTRPQGYNDDFSPATYRHVSLAPLPADLARRYGTRLAQARHRTDADRQQRIASRLDRALQNQSTAKLMTSPLQVTIMATLVDRGGQPPEQRWKLFSEYYGVIYRRELEREIPAVDVLREHKPDIDAVHRRVALILQVEGEHASHAEARMTSDRFASIVRSRLVDEGHEGPELARVEGEIITAAADRLVFLVGLEADAVGFEIRSLQEFMAAEALMDGTEQAVTERLRAIAGVTSWRNVFLFAAGHCFAERQHLRDTVNTICGELNDPKLDPLAPLVRPGSVLATDLLSDGLTRTQPTYSRLLANEATRLVGRPISEKRLVQSYDEALGDIYAEAVRDGLGNPRTKAHCISLLAALDEQGVGWSETVLNRNVSAGGQGLIEALGAAGEIQSSWLTARVARFARELGLAAIFKYDAALASMAKSLPGNPVIGVATAIEEHWILGNREGGLALEGLDLTPFELALRWIDGALAEDVREIVERSDPVALDGAWVGLNAALDFTEESTAAALSRQLKMIASSVPSSDWSAVARLSSWPLAASLEHAAGSRQALLELADLAEDGKLGDLAPWMAGERRWQDIGVTREDIEYTASTNLPFDAEIANRGFPFAEDAGMRRTYGGGSVVAHTLSAWFDSTDDEQARSRISQWLAFVLNEQHPLGDHLFSAERYCGYLAFEPGLDDRNITYPLIASLNWRETPTREEAEALDKLGSTLRDPGQGNRLDSTFIMPSPELQQSLIRCWNTGRNRTDGLFRVLAIGSASKIEGLAEAPEIAARNPGAAGLLALKEGASGRGIRDAVEKMAEVWNREPIWLWDALNVIADRIEEPIAELIAATLWDALPSLSPKSMSYERLREAIEELGEGLANRRSTDLDDTNTWEALDFFDQPPAAQRSS